MSQIGTLARSTFEVCDALYQMLSEAKEELGLEDVWYSPQALIPRYPCIILEPRPRRRRFNATHRWELTFEVSILLYHGKVDSSEVNHRANELQAGLVENFLHADPNRLTLNGLVVMGFVVNAEPGLVNRGDVMITATRLTWQGESREEF